MSRIHCLRHRAFVFKLILFSVWLLIIITRIGVFAQGQILCISPNGLQAGPRDNDLFIFTLKMTLRVIPHPSYLGKDSFHTEEAT